jgi:hypothetical protein
MQVSRAKELQFTIIQVHCCIPVTPRAREGTSPEEVAAMAGIPGVEEVQTGVRVLTEV